MFMRIHAVVQVQDDKLMPRLGNPSDHQLEDEQFTCRIVPQESLGMEIGLWCKTTLDEAQQQQAVSWVIKSLGFIS